MEKAINDITMQIAMKLLCNFVLPGIMEIFSVKRKVVGIRSVAHRDRYLCMNRAGKVFTRVSYFNYSRLYKNILMQKAKQSKSNNLF